jgi:hypothetical protein
MGRADIRHNDIVMSISHLTVLGKTAWTERARAHGERVDQWTQGRLARARAGEKHPVDDFLYEYYPTRPRQFRRWHPGLGYAMADADSYTNDRHYRSVVIDAVTAMTVDPSQFSHRRDGLAWVEGLVRTSAQRPARTGCFGLHEWAMVYGSTQEEVRHKAWPLRLSPSKIRATVDDIGLRCTHFDAYRFFTPEAAPNNEFELSRAAQPEFDQPGCLHATMDLYKWSEKYAALVGSDLVADCFELALEARTLDMQAAPYDLLDLGYEPIAIETPAGRAEYVRRQRDLMDASAPLRLRVIDALGSALTAIDASIYVNASADDSVDTVREHMA